MLYGPDRASVKNSCFTVGSAAQRLTVQENGTLGEKVEPLVSRQRLYCYLANGCRHQDRRSNLMVLTERDNTDEEILPFDVSDDVLV